MTHGHTPGLFLDFPFSGACRFLSHARFSGCASPRCTGSAGARVGRGPSRSRVSREKIGVALAQALVWSWEVVLLGFLVFWAVLLEETRGERDFGVLLLVLGFEREPGGRQLVGFQPGKVQANRAEGCEAPQIQREAKRKPTACRAWTFKVSFQRSHAATVQFRGGRGAERRTGDPGPGKREKAFARAQLRPAGQRPVPALPGARSRRVGCSALWSVGAPEVASGTWNFPVCS